jgi:hypothetical protein
MTASTPPYFAARSRHAAGDVGAAAPAFAFVGFVGRV